MDTAVKLESVLDKLTRLTNQTISEQSKAEELVGKVSALKSSFEENDLVISQQALEGVKSIMGGVQPLSWVWSKSIGNNK